MDELLTAKRIPAQFNDKRKLECLLTPKQLSELLQVDLSTVYLWTHTQFIPHYKLGRSVRFLESDVQIWLQKRKSNGRTAFKYDVAWL